MSTVLTKKMRRNRPVEPIRRQSRPSQLAVVGNGPVGFRFLTSFSGSPLFSQYRVTVFGEEAIPAYDRIHLSDCFAGKAKEDLIYQPRQWYLNQGIELKTGDPVIQIDRHALVVRTRDDQAYPYDLLVLATGSRPFVPPIEGVELPGVFVYRTLADVQNIQDFAGRCKTGVVIGGGLLGLEAARALSQQGVQDVAILESSPFLMARQLDKHASVLLRSKIESLGYRVLTGTTASGIFPHDQRLEIRLADESSLLTEIIVIAAGIRPRDELARECGLELAPRGGIMVNDVMQTSDPNIYACGECAAHNGIVYGLVAPGFDMADVVADQLGGRIEGRGLKFADGNLSTELKLLEINVAALGETANPRPGFHEITFDDGNVYRKLTMHGSRIIGGMYVGDWNHKHRIRDAINRQQYVWPWQLSRFLKTGDLWKQVETPHVADWPASSIICTCTSTTRGEISLAVAAGAATVEAVTQRTGASTVCGSCHPLLAELCGNTTKDVLTKQHSLAAASVLAFIGIALIFLIGPLPVPVSVRESNWFDVMLLSESWKQISGFSLLGLTALATSFSLRKRIPAFRWGKFLTWRAVHAWTAALTILGLYWHTGFRPGANLNFLLFSLFVSANLIGACTGTIAALETNASGQTARFSRAARPWMTWFHIVGVWPLPVVLVFHILSAYCFN